MALVREDYTRAHAYLAPDLPRYPPTPDILVRDLEGHGLMPYRELNPCVYVEMVTEQDDTVRVRLRVQYYDVCWRGMPEVRNLSYNTVDLTLSPTEDGWQIIYGQGAFICSDWFRPPDGE